MGVSTNSIFHFTKKKSVLNSILKDGGFKITFSLEEYHLSERMFQAAIPMVSFCDIPLSKVISHMNSYGSYAIGLSKEWASRNRLNPVIYMVENSYCVSLIEPLLINTIENDEFENINIRYTIKKDKNKHLLENVYTGERKLKIDSLIGLLSYIKNHNGELYRSGKLINKNYRYYDEREWRYVPSYDEFDNNQLSYIPFLKKDEYIEWREREDRFLPFLLLKFTAMDIEYIIVKNDKEISSTIKQLSRLNSLYKNEDEYRILISKLYSAKKIKDDI